MRKLESGGAAGVRTRVMQMVAGIQVARPVAGLAVLMLLAAMPVLLTAQAAVSDTAAEAPPPAPAIPAAAQPSTDTAPPAAATAVPQPSAPPMRLYMPDGQLKSHRLVLYVTGDIQPSQRPRLQLFRSHAVTSAADGEEIPLEPSFVGPGQQWTEPVQGRDIQRSGTILLFDGSQIPFGLRATIRVRPALLWTDGAAERSVVADHEVNIGNIVADIGWTAAIVGIAFLIVVLLSWKAAGDPVLLLTGVDGHLSLAQTQVACWTLAVGSVVLGYGLIRLTIPDIPSSLLVLMGASLLTGGVANFRDAQKQGEATQAGVVSEQRAWAWGDLVRVFTAGQPPELSLSKAQMLFWTVLLLALFVSKSILDGAIWEVPWPLVALMGFSQAGYLAPKLVPQA